MRRSLWLVTVLLLLATGSSAQSLSGVWTLGEDERAKCQYLRNSGRETVEFPLGPLEILELGSEIRMRTSQGTLQYQGTVIRPTVSDGNAVATSCTAVTSSKLDVPGTFYLTRLNATKGTLQGTFIGRQQSKSALLVCKLKASRPAFSEPALAACPP